MKKTIKQNQANAVETRLESSCSRMWDSSRRYGKVDVLTAKTFLSFICTFDQFASHLGKITGTSGITRAGINVLTILRSSADTGCNQQKLSQLLLVSRANVTGLIDGLIRKKLAQRMPDAVDRRACIVRITQKGEQLLDKILPQYHEQIAKVFSGLNDSEKKSFNKVMKKLRLSITALEKQKS
jgi:MarR family transcriptional regulator, 2-MHQ and catechol-resistance regulon repressor